MSLILVYLLSFFPEAVPDLLFCVRYDTTHWSRQNFFSIFFPLDYCHDKAQMTLLGWCQWKERGKMQSTGNWGARINEHMKTTLCKLLLLDSRNLESRSITALGGWLHEDMAVEACVLFSCASFFSGRNWTCFCANEKEGSHEIRLEIEEILLYLQLDEKWDWLWTEGSGCL